MNTLLKRTNGNGNMPVTTFSGLVDKIFQNNISRLFDDDAGTFKTSQNIPVNVQETDKSYELELVAPGLKKDDFKVHVQGDMLTVSFEHQDEQNQQNKKEGWLRREYQKSSFSRTFHLDDTVDAGKINAKYNDGILYVSLPKKEGAQRVARAIEIE